jgi:hypothetical protein
MIWQRVIDVSREEGKKIEKGLEKKSTWMVIRTKLPQTRKGDQ